MTHIQLIEKQRKCLLIYAERYGVSRACKTFNVSRTSFYNIKKSFIETGSLAPKQRRKPRMPNEIPLSKKKLLLEMVKEHPAWGPTRYAYEFRKRGILIAQSCVWYHLKRFGLNQRYKRLIYLEQLKLKDHPLTERSLKQIKTQCHNIKQGLWPGQVIALDTFYIGNLKGVGRIYQITGLDLCSRFGWAKLYANKEQTSSIDFVENILLPKFFNNNVELESVLTDNGSEFIGSHFRKMLDDYEIAHYRIPKGKPICNGYCERFQRTIFEELYQKVFRTKFFKSLDTLQKELDNYLVFYNFERPHFGLKTTGAIPIDIFKSRNTFLRQRFQKLLT